MYTGIQVKLTLLYYILRRTGKVQSISCFQQVFQEIKVGSKVLFSLVTVTGLYCHLIGMVL